MTTAKVEKTEINYIHKNAILAETVRKENFHSKLYTDYSVNPYKKIHTLTEKPNAEVKDDEVDSHFLQVIQRSNLEPTKKYTYPATESQEIGWITRPLLDIDRSDRRLFHPRNTCEMTRFMDVYWKGRPPKEVEKKA